MEVALNVLIVDPVLGTGGLMDLAGKLRRRWRWQRQEMSDTYVPDAYFELVSEARFGDDPGKSRWQALYAEAFRSRLPMDPERERDPQWWADDWVDIWRNNPDAVMPWLTQGHRVFASAVSSATGIPITVQPWNELAWLTDPSVVADALNQEFEGPRPDHVEGGALGT